MVPAGGLRGSGKYRRRKGGETRKEKYFVWPTPAGASTYTDMFDWRPQNIGQKNKKKSHLSASSAPCSLSTSCSPAARAERSRDRSAASASASSSALRAACSDSLASPASFDRNPSDWRRRSSDRSRRSSVSRSVPRRASAAAEASSERASTVWRA